MGHSTRGAQILRASAQLAIPVVTKAKVYSVSTWFLDEILCLSPFTAGGRGLKIICAWLFNMLCNEKLPYPSDGPWGRPISIWFAWRRWETAVWTAYAPSAALCLLLCFHGDLKKPRYSCCIHIRSGAANVFSSSYVSTLAQSRDLLLWPEKGISALVSSSSSCRSKVKRYFSRLLWTFLFAFSKA